MLFVQQFELEKRFPWSQLFLSCSGYALKYESSDTKWALPCSGLKILILQEKIIVTDSKMMNTTNKRERQEHNKETSIIQEQHF
jgi:hypothetical protein